MHDLSLVSIVAASADDESIGSSCQDFGEVWAIAEEELGKFNLKVRRDKDQIYWFNQSEAAPEFAFPEGINVSQEGIVILGVPIGSQGFQSKFLKDLLESHRLLLSKILRLGNTQVALVMSRMCANTRVGFAQSTFSC